MIRRRPHTILAALATALVTAVAALLIGAPQALAIEGTGLLGHVSDLTITLLFFGVILFFPIMVTVLSIIQGRLESRKEQRRYDLERFS